MSKPRIRLKPSPATSPDPNAEETIVDLEMQRRLRRDLKLTSADMAGIDLALAIEAGLIKKPDTS